MTSSTTGPRSLELERRSRIKSSALRTLSPGLGACAIGILLRTTNDLNVCVHSKLPCSCACTFFFFFWNLLAERERRNTEEQFVDTSTASSHLQSGSSARFFSPTPKNLHRSSKLKDTQQEERRAEVISQRTNCWCPCFLTSLLRHGPGTGSSHNCCTTNRLGCSDILQHLQRAHRRVGGQASPRS